MLFFSHVVVCLWLNAFANADLFRDDDQPVVTKREAAECSLCEIKSMLLQMNDSISRIKEHLNISKSIAIKNCADLHKKGHKTDGVYQINPDGRNSFEVSCDMTTDGGGWTIFQRRQDGSVDFYRGWKDYKHGFGEVDKEFWLGLDKIHELTTATKNTLRVDMADTFGNTRYAFYDSFAVSNEDSKYELSLGKYSGTAGDSLSYAKGRPFTTKDIDNDGEPSANCASVYKGAWWYNKCHYSNLNGRYYNGTHTSYADGINWFTWKGYNYSLMKTEMKVRPLDFK